MGRAVEQVSPYDAVIDGRIVPFAGHGDASVQKMSVRRRTRELIDFIGYDFSGLRTLDIGPPNALGKALGFKDNTEGNLNHGLDWQRPMTERYDLILCSEILEHTMNPLLLIGDCYLELRSGGHLIVSTPIVTWHSGISLRSPHHLTEYRPERLRRLFEYVGFDIERYRTICIWDRRFAFTGIRPLLRVLFHRSQLWMLRKP